MCLAEIRDGTERLTYRVRVDYQHVMRTFRILAGWHAGYALTVGVLVLGACSADHSNGANSNPTPGRPTMPGNPKGASVAWAWGGGSSDNDEGLSVAVLADGSTYVAGSFFDTASFGSVSISSGAGKGVDMLVVKSNPDGTLGWVRGDVADSGAEARAVAALPDGSAYVTGSFSGRARFDGTVLQSIGASDVFLAKYASDGSLVWAASAGGPGIDDGSSVALLVDGSAYVTGFFSGSANFGSTMLESESNSDGFLAKYGSDGTVVWARRVASAGRAVGRSVAALADGSIYMTGTFTGSTAFGVTTFQSEGETDIFLAKYNPDGSVSWVQRAGGSAIDLASSVATLAEGSAYITGYFNGTADFGGETLQSASAFDDVFLAKYGFDGSLAWVRSAGGAQADRGASVAVLPEGTAYVTGTFKGAATFGAITVESEIDEAAQRAGATDPTTFDMFLAKYNPDGSAVWVQTAGGPVVDAARSVAVAGDGAYVTGAFAGTAKFGQKSLIATYNRDFASSDVFLAKFTEPTK